MSRLPNLARLTRPAVAILATALVLLVVGACSEQFPLQFAAAQDSGLDDADDPWDLDDRPVSPTCRAFAKAPLPVGGARIAYELVTTAPLKDLVDVVSHDGRIYVVEKKGVIHYLASDGKTAPVVLDIGSQLTVGYDSGLVSLAFHPQFAQNGYVYLAFMVPHPQQPPPPNVVFKSVVARFQSFDGGLTIDPSTQKRILVRDQPGVNHNGNKVAFGNDGYLYFSVGDGSLDSNVAQDKNKLFGKVLRIDVDSGDPYGIPPTNPFAKGGGAPEVYAYGFRNPWRFSFDRPTGDLWLGDVGANTWEEINRVVPGGNYGWPILEGPDCYTKPGCDRTGLIPPVALHKHDGTPDGIGAVIGGVVYRGTSVPSITGQYVYADVVTGNWWSFDPAAKAPIPVRLDRGLERVAPVSIDLDDKGEVIFATYDSRVFRIVSPPEMPLLLSDTGCVDTTDPRNPAAGLFAYAINVPQWMDGAVADRFLSVPADQNIEVNAQGRLLLPPGSVAVRTLRKDSTLVETQLLLRRPDSSWSAYTYAWSAEQTDATLASVRTDIGLPTGRAHQIRPKECVGCHDVRGGGTLGLEVGQLDRTSKPHGSHSAIATLVHVGLIGVPVPPQNYQTVPPTTGNDTDEHRARAYLHANCSFCHDGTDPALLDLRSTSPLPDAQGGVCLIVPSMRATEAGRMPPIGSTTPDEDAIRVIETWVGSLQVCP